MMCLLDDCLGEYASAIETLVTASSLIKQSKVAHDDRCKILISSLQDTLHGIENKSYGGRSRGKRVGLLSSCPVARPAQSIQKKNHNHNCVCLQSDLDRVSGSGSDIAEVVERELEVATGNIVIIENGTTESGTGKSGTTENGIGKSVTIGNGMNETTGSAVGQEVELMLGILWRMFLCASGATMHFDFCGDSRRWRDFGRSFCALRSRCMNMAASKLSYYVDCVCLFLCARAGVCTPF